MQINAALFYIKLIKNAVVADTQFKFRPALQSVVRETLQPRTHFIHLAVNRIPNM